MLFKSMRLNQKELELTVLGLRYAMSYEIEFLAAHSHMKDKDAKELQKESEKLIRSFRELKQKIQGFLINSPKENKRRRK